MYLRTHFTVLQKSPVMDCHFVPILGLVSLLALALLGHLHLEPGLGDGLGPGEPRHDHVHQQETSHGDSVVMVAMALVVWTMLELSDDH